MTRSIPLVVAALISGASLKAQQPSTMTATADTALARADATTPDSGSRVVFDIPAQPLPDALGDFARQAGVRIVANGVSLAGERGREVVGRLTVVEAAERLLAGTGLLARFTDDATVVVSARSTSAPSRLAAVVVTGSAVRQAGYTAARTISATRTDALLLNTPQSVTVVTQELIADQAMRGMAEVVRYLPGITMGQGEGHRDAPTIRGTSTTADFYVDGVRDDVQYLRDLYNVDRVEALKGANALVFGRGGGGGVINRVNKEAQWAPVRALSLAGGSYAHSRGALDVGQGLGRHAAVRLNAMAERSGGFRDAFSLARVGINPTAAIRLGARTTARVGYELFRDDRTVDRGIPSFQGRPSSAPVGTFFGDPSQSFVDARVHAATSVFEHATGRGLTLRNRTRFAHYDRFYQNVYPGAVTADGAQVALSAYNHGMIRDNLFNQTDVTMSLDAAGTVHTLLVGVEVGRQGTRNQRETGRFAGGTSVRVPFASPTVTMPVTFERATSDADNRVTANVASVYVQDRMALTSKLEAIVGARLERFALDVTEQRDGATLSRTDDMVSPRGGLVFKPVEAMSVYGSLGVSHLPASGDQFASLTASTRTLEPERFTNLELGAKWDVRPDVALTAAAYRLDRTNTTARDPNDPARTVQTGEQRTSGWEVGLAGRPVRRWELAGGVAVQRATIVSATTAAAAGRTVPLVPRTTASLWNRLHATDRVGLGVGVIHQGRSYAAIDNAVTLPAFTRLDGGLFVTVTPGTRVQLNVENVLDTRYYATSHGNNNIMPGSPRAARVSLVAGF